MTNAKIVQLAKILTNAANSDMRHAKASLKRNLDAGRYQNGSMAVLGTSKGNLNVEVTPCDKWFIHCGNGDCLLNGDAKDAREFLIDCYVLEGDVQ